MACTVGRRADIEAQVQGEERRMKLTQDRLSIICLYRWLREQKDKRHYPSGYCGDPEITMYTKGANYAFNVGQAKMETLFPWLKK